MKIAIMGSGGVGGYFGARLAVAGEDVTFIARGGHLAAMKAGGLRLISDKGDVTIQPVQATDDPASIGPVDFVLFAVKLYDTESAGELVRPLVRDGGAVVDLQNGIDSGSQLASILGAEAVIGGVAYISSHIDEPGVIRHVGQGAKLAFGEFDGTKSERVIKLEAACQAAAIDASAVENIETALWSKLAMLAPMSAISCLTRLPVNEFRAVPETADLLWQGMQEVVKVAEAEGIHLSEDTFAPFRGVTGNSKASVKPSMLVDLERGKPLEIEFLSGAIARRGEKLGIETPFHRMATAILLTHVKGKI